MLSGAALLRAEAVSALSQPELGLLKLKRSLDLLSARVQENLKSAAESAAQPKVWLKTELDCKALLVSIHTSGAAKCERVSTYRIVRPRALFSTLTRLSIVHVTVTNDSKVLTDSEYQTLRRFVGEDQWKELELKLLYRGSRDGFAAADFHRLCDGKGPTLTIVQTPQGWVFGGYASSSWNSTTGGFVSALDSFLFTLRNSRNLPPQKFTLKEPASPMYCHANYGPTFGAGRDLCVASQANANSQSYSDLGTSYARSAGCTSDLFAGAKYFTVAEVEVYGTLRACPM